MHDVLLSIVIVTWNTRIQTINCLKSILHSKDYKIYYKTYKDKLEITVIDNNSSDDTPSEIERNFTCVRLIKNDTNIGYAPACNQGMKTAKGKYVLLLGSDTMVKDNSLIKCIRFLENNPECGAVGCKLTYPDGNTQGNCKKFPTLKNAIFTYMSLNSLNKDYDMLWFNYDKTIEVEQIATTFLMVRNDTLKKINYFDEQYKIMYNDVDLCEKIWDTGKKIFFLHDAEVIHHGSLSTRKAKSVVRKIMYKDIYRYYRNNYGRSAVVLIPILFLRFMIVSLSKH